MLARAIKIAIMLPWIEHWGFYSLGGFILTRFVFAVLKGIFRVDPFVWLTRKFRTAHPRRWAEILRWGSAALVVVVVIVAVNINPIIFAKQNNPAFVTGPVYVDCEMASPKVQIPQSGVYYAFDVQFAVVQRPFSRAPEVPLERFSGPAGSIADLGMPFLYRCSVANYDTRTPLFNILYPMRIIQREAIPQKNGFHSGKTLSDTIVWARIPHLDPGRDNPFNFYLMNETNTYAELLMGLEITAHIGVESALIIIRIVPPEVGEISLPPYSGGKH
jgi:hypothetical protein